jgi:hypothetical protein
MSVSINGYSERGIMNGLFYEIYYSKNSIELIEKLLSQIRFPYKTSKNNFSILQCEILIEQSFSDFGDADLLLLIKTPFSNISMFLEAKVKSYRGIAKEYHKFIDGLESTVSSSNFIVQLYHKTRLVETLKNKGLLDLESGIEFSSSSSKHIRRIGSNKVVLKSVEKLSGYLDETYYVAILPDEEQTLAKFYQNEIINLKPNNYKKWDVNNYGYLD